MKKKLNIALTFSPKQTARIRPAVLGVHVYPLNHSNIGNFMRRQEWALEYHSRDAGFIELRNDPNNWRERRARSIHIYAPECCYREDTTKADFPLEENWFLFNDDISSVFRQWINPDLLFGAIIDPEEKIGGLMLNAAELCESGGKNMFWKVQSLFMEIIQTLMTARQLSREEWLISDKAEAEKDFVTEVERYMRENINRNIKISDIAHYMKVSDSSLNHKFKQTSGISPISRLIEIRIEFAKTLLLKGEKLINIADMAGFYDEYHLSKSFKKNTGLTPRQFKNQKTQD